MNINAEHPEYKAKKGMYRRYRDPYRGGEQLKLHGREYLTQRQKEAAEVYEERLNRVFYENYVGSIIDWYAATLFRREPLLHIDGDDGTARQFFNVFAEDSDLRGSSLTDFYRKQFVDALVFGASYTLVDFPPRHGAVKTRAEEDANGLSRAYLVGFTPEHLVNWSRDERGDFEWVVLRTAHTSKPGPESGDWQEETTWTCYDRQRYRILRSSGREGEEPAVVGEGLHGLAALNTVPLFETRPAEGLWLMNKAGLIQLEHFNKSNSLAWAIHMGLYAMPVVYTDRTFDKIMGDSYYIQLGQDDNFGWTEPEGKVFEIAAANLARLQEEIYRICYLSHQSGTSGSQVSQSGLSKLRDFAITQEVLRCYGDLIKDSMKRVLRTIAAARQDSITIDVAGLDDFDIADFRNDLDDAGRLLELGIESPTLRKQIFKRLAHKYLCDVRQEVKDRISEEIDAQPV